MTDEAKNKSDKGSDIYYHTAAHNFIVVTFIYANHTCYRKQALKLESNVLIYNLNVNFSSNLDDKKIMYAFSLFASRPM